jgi:hypothetical protein
MPLAVHDIHHRLTALIRYVVFRFRYKVLFENVYIREQTCAEDTNYPCLQKKSAVKAQICPGAHGNMDIYYLSRNQTDKKKTKQHYG